MMKILLLIILPTVVYGLDKAFNCYVPLNITIEVAPRITYGIAENENRPRRPFMRALPQRQMAGHHVIPYTTLRAFYNAVLSNQRPGFNMDHVHAFGASLQIMITNVYNRSNRSTFTRESYDACLAFVRAMRNHQYRSPLNMTTWQLTEGRLYVTTLFSWLPGNIFVGPSNRYDDPGSDVDTVAEYVMEPDHYRRLVVLYGMMNRYVNQNEPDPFDVIIGVLNQIFNHPIMMYPYIEAQWVRNAIGKFGIRTTTTPRPTRHPHDELRRRKREDEDASNSIAMDGDSCRGVYRGQNFQGYDMTACLFARSAINFASEYELGIDHSTNTLSGVKFPHAEESQWSSGLSGQPYQITNDYYLSGKVQNVRYTVNNKKCFIAVEDRDSVFNKKFHRTVDADFCLTAVDAFILADEVVVKARPDRYVNSHNEILDLTLRSLCE